MNAAAGEFARDRSYKATSLSLLGQPKDFLKCARLDLFIRPDVTGSRMARNKEGKRNTSLAKVIGGNEKGRFADFQTSCVQCYGGF